MTRQEIIETRKRAKAYSKEKTFIYVKEVMPSGRENFYNGFIIKFHNDMIIFYDLVLKKDFPILFGSIEVIEPSRKEIDIKTALEVYKNAKT